MRPLSSLYKAIIRPLNMAIIRPLYGHKIFLYYDTLNKIGASLIYILLSICRGIHCPLLYFLRPMGDSSSSTILLVHQAEGDW